MTEAVKEVKNEPTEVDSDFKAAARISPATWGLVVLLIATLAGWGTWTAVNASDISKQAAKIDNKAEQTYVDHRLDQKADKETVNQQYSEIIHRLDDLKTDIRDIRRGQRKDAQTSGGPSGGGRE